MAQLLELAMLRNQIKKPHSKIYYVNYSIVKCVRRKTIICLSEREQKE